MMCKEQPSQIKKRLPKPTPVYDAEFFEPSSKRQRGLGLGWHIALIFVLLTGLLIGLLGIWLT